MRVDALQIAFERTELELKRTKIELALSEERRAENEICYKNEINYFIDKLLKTKNKLLKLRQQANSCTSLSNITNMRSKSSLGNSVQRQRMIEEMEKKALNAIEKQREKYMMVCTQSSQGEDGEENLSPDMWN